MMGEKRIGVVIPAYNRADALKRSLESVARQTLKPNQVFVIDDCSEEDLESIVEEFKSRLPIQYLRLSEKGNANVARNAGIDQCQCDYVAMLDSDDEWKSNHLKQSLAYLIENNLDGCYGGITIFKNGTEQRTIIPRQKKPEESPIEYLYSGGLTSTPTMVMRKSIFESILFDEGLERHQDLDFSIRVFLSGFKIASTEDATTLVHWNSDGPRKVNMNAAQLFFQKHKHQFTPALAFEFHRNLYHSARVTNNIEPETVKYFRSQAKKFAPDLPSYFSIDEPNSTFEKIGLALKFYLPFIA